MKNHQPGDQAAAPERVDSFFGSNFLVHRVLNKRRIFSGKSEEEKTKRENEFILLCRRFDGKSSLPIALPRRFPFRLFQLFR
jgi:hypothetical protein